MATIKNGSTILLVDDEAMVLSLSRIILERQGYTVCAAASGQEAIDICRRGEPELNCAIIDYTMPGINGRDTLIAVRQECPGLPVIIASGRGGDEMEKELAGTGVSAIMQKPFRRDVLLATVGEILSLNRL